MGPRRARAIRFFVAVASAAALCLPSAAAAEVKGVFLYTLSDFTGTIPYNWQNITVDRKNNEVYVVDQGHIRIYGESGMEIFRFGDNPALGVIRDVAVDEKGDLYILSYDLSPPASGSDLPKFVILHCNYRGEPGERITITNLPTEYSQLHPTVLIYREGRFLLVDKSRMQSVWVNKKGAFRQGFDFAQLLDIPPKNRSGSEMFGFSLDGEGNMLFTIPVLFQAFKVSPDGSSIESFGKPGSAPGMFGIVAGIVADDRGNLLVSDALRSVVMVFDRTLNFVTEFGHYGDRPSNLVRPREMAMGRSGKLYVTQMRRRGISVFSVAPN